MTAVVVPLMEGRERFEILARAYAFWFNLPSEPAMLARFKAQKVGDFAATFAAKCGLPLREFFLILFTLHLGFEAQALKDPNPLLLDEKAYLWPTFGEENVRKVLSAVSQPPDQLALSLLGTPRQNWAIDCTPLREHPVVEVFPGKRACTDPDLLHRCLTNRIYFMLQKAYPERAFEQLFGYVFEGYVNRLVRHFAYAGESLCRQFYEAPRFRGTEDEAGDGIIVWQDSALVMEYKSRLLTTREKYSGITEVMQNGIDDIVGKRDKKKGVYQLAKVVARLLRGEPVVAGSPKVLVLKDCQRIHPVLVTYEEAIGLEAIRQQAEAKFNGASRSRRRNASKSASCWS